MIRNRGCVIAWYGFNRSVTDAWYPPGNTTRSPAETAYEVSSGILRHVICVQKPSSGPTQTPDPARASTSATGTAGSGVEPSAPVTQGSPSSRANANQPATTLPHPPTSAKRVRTRNITGAGKRPTKAIKRTNRKAGAPAATVPVSLHAGANNHASIRHASETPAPGGVRNPPPTRWLILPAQHVPGAPFQSCRGTPLCIQPQRL